MMERDFENFDYLSLLLNQRFLFIALINKYNFAVGVWQMLLVPC